MIRSNAYLQIWLGSRFQHSRSHILVTVSTFNVTVTTVTCQWHAADCDRATAAIDTDSDANSESLRPRIRVITVMDFTTLSHCNRFRVRTGTVPVGANLSEWLQGRVRHT